MKQYIESFHIFKEANRGCKYPLSAEMVEKELINMLNNLHHVYLNDKVQNGISYTLSSKISLAAYGDTFTMQEHERLHHTIAHVITTHLIDRHRIDVELHFQNNHPNDCDYCDLLKGTIFKEMVDDKKCKEEIEYKKPAQYMYVHVYDDEKPHSSFGCTLTKAQKEILVYFINQFHINYDVMTLLDIEDFLNCKEGFCLRPKNNRKAILILMCLEEHGFINANWQFLVATHKLMKSSTGKKFLEQGDLSSPKHIINRKDSKKPDPMEKRIIDFVGELKNVKDHSETAV